MNILIDTNVFLDFALMREPFYECANKIIGLCSDEVICGFLAAHTITNAYFIMRKMFNSKERRKIIFELCKFLTIVTLDEHKIKSALQNTEFKDFEDCLQAECAADCRAEYIVTRNADDFAGSKVLAITPEELIKRIG